MAVKTTNGYGKISVSEEAIAITTGYVARDCYGVVDLYGSGLIDLFNKRHPLSRGVKVYTMDNRISIDVSVALKYGVNVRAVSESLKKTIKYRVEEFTGMIVESVNVHIVGVRV